MQRPFLASLVLLLGVLVTLGAPLRATAAPVQLQEKTAEKPWRIRDVDVQERLDERIPTSLAFRDDDGDAVTLGQYLRSGRPLILTLNYSDCPMLCNHQLNGLVAGLKQLDWTVGKEFDIVTVSLDPEETVERAKKAKNSYVRDYGRPEAQQGWHFLTGSRANIQALASAVGISYAYNEKRDEYLHPAVITLVTPDGRIARYQYGLEYHPKTLRLGLVESGDGKIGSTVDRLVLYCFHYDSSEGRYAPVAQNIMKVGGGVTVVLLGGLLGAFWIAERRRRGKPRSAGRASPEDASAAGNDPPPASNEGT